MDRSVVFIHCNFCFKWFGGNSRWIRLGFVGGNERKFSNSEYGEETVPFPRITKIRGQVEYYYSLYLDILLR
jgi:hypothetical protein